MAGVLGREEEGHLVDEVVLTLCFQQLSSPGMESDDFGSLLDFELAVHDDVHPDGGLSHVVDVVPQLFPDAADHLPLFFVAPPDHCDAWLGLREASVKSPHHPQHSAIYLI